jgi:hypothetical protein
MPTWSGIASVPPIRRDSRVWVSTSSCGDFRRMKPEPVRSHFVRCVRPPTPCIFVSIGSVHCLCALQCGMFIECSSHAGAWSWQGAGSR